MKNVTDFAKMKNAGEKISFVTCYDSTYANIIRDSDIDAVLVGDSVAMVMHGFDTTVNADISIMELHAAAVRKGLGDKFMVVDMPFLAHRKGIEYMMNCVDRLMKAGAQAVKIEGAGDNLAAIKYVVESGVPVMGHLGLTPQSVHQFGGFKVQGKSNEAAEKLLADAKALQEAGCFALVFELVPAELAKIITEELVIPTIGIGAGAGTSGQVLVLQDLLGMNNQFSPKFLRKYLNGYDIIKDALNNYNNDVKEVSFPSDKESF